MLTVFANSFLVGQWVIKVTNFWTVETVLSMRILHKLVINSDIMCLIESWAHDRILIVGGVDRCVTGLGCCEILCLSSHLE